MEMMRKEAVMGWLEVLMPSYQTSATLASSDDRTINSLYRYDRSFIHGILDTRATADGQYFT